MASVEDDVRSFEAMYDLYAPAVARFAWSVSPTSGAAQDLLQETFLTAWTKRRSVRLVDGSPLPWLLTTCHNHARNHARRERKWGDLLELREESLSSAGRSTRWPDCPTASAR
jgi:DNA-directed RNA polymerase specialized sigma24 family protein